MKKTRHNIAIQFMALIFLGFGIFGFTNQASAQDPVPTVDFEVGGVGADWDWTTFENVDNPPLEVIDNPDQSGINTSDKVGKFTARADGAPWAGTTGRGDFKFLFDSENRTITIMVWKSVISDVGIKLETESGWAESEIRVANTVVNEWEELTFDFTGRNFPPGGEAFNGISVFPDFNTEGRGQENIIYFDNISFDGFVISEGNGGGGDAPTTAAPTPTVDPANVISVFSDAYTDVEGTNFNPGWGQATQVSFVNIEGSNTMRYSNFNYQGTEFAAPVNAAGMDFINIDMWTPDATAVNFTVISPGPQEKLFPLEITQGEWVTYSIPLSYFDNVDLSDIIQLKFDGGNAEQTLYLDNIFFYTDTSVPGEPVPTVDFEVDGVGADWAWTTFENADNPPLEVIDNPDQSGINTSDKVGKFTARADGAPWAGTTGRGDFTFLFNEDNRTITIMVWKSVLSDVGIKLETASGWAEPEIRVANTVVNEWEELTFDFTGRNLPPEGESFNGISVFPDFNTEGRGQENIIYFDNIAFEGFEITGENGGGNGDGPQAAAPTPTVDPAKVISVFSDAYDDHDGTNFNPGWGQATQVSIIDIDGSSTLKYANFNYQGTEFATAINASAMTTINIDMWTADATSVNFTIISPGPQEKLFPLEITPGEWVTYEIPLEYFDNVDLSDIFQLKFDGGNGTPTIYLDNIFFYDASVNVENGKNHPNAFRLAQNYPNPHYS